LQGAAGSSVPRTKNKGRPGAARGPLLPRPCGLEAAISRGVDTAELAKKVGAHHYIDSSASDPAAALQALGGAKAILCVWFSFVLRLVC
jgi:hypothetical protein